MSVADRAEELVLTGLIRFPLSSAARDSTVFRPFHQFLRQKTIETMLVRIGC